MSSHMHTQTERHTSGQVHQPPKSAQLHKAAEGLDAVHKLFRLDCDCRKAEAQSATVFDVVLQLVNPAESSPLEAECNSGQV